MILTGGLLKKHPAGGPGRWSRKVVSDKECQINIYMILTGGILKTHPTGGPERWCEIKNVKKIIYMIIRYGTGRWCHIKNVCEIDNIYDKCENIM
jgi:hypothetical protein